jgi:tetratricopeptide (TPR) repeat protein
MAQGAQSRPGIGSRRNLLLTAAAILLAVFLLYRGTSDDGGVDEFMKADTLRLQGNVDQAIAAFNAIIDRRPGYSSPYNGRGESYRIKGDLDRALADFNEAIRLHPEYADAYYNRCRLFRSRGRIDDAVKDCEAAVRLKPTEPGPHVQLATMLLDRGEYAKAAPVLDTAIPLHPSNAALYFLRGQLRLFHENRPSDAADDLAKGLKEAFSYRDLSAATTSLKPDGTARELMAAGHTLLPDALYMMIWSRIARTRSGVEDRTETEGQIRALGSPIFQQKMTQISGNIEAEVRSKTLAPWPGAILRLFLGETSPEAVRAQAEAEPTADLRLRRLCDADFYLAQHHLQRQDASKAKPLLKSAADSCPKAATEQRFALAELKRLGP